MKISLYKDIENLNLLLTNYWYFATLMIKEKHTANGKWEKVKICLKGDKFYLPDWNSPLLWLSSACRGAHFPIV